jgi:hypothetical protein
MKMNARHFEAQSNELMNLRAKPSDCERCVFRSQCLDKPEQQKFWDNRGVGEESIAFYPLVEKDVFCVNTFPARQFNFKVLI